MQPPHAISETQPRPSSPAENLAIVRQMLATLDTVTLAGQRHLMTKVVALVDAQVDRAIQHVGRGNRRTLQEQLTLLKRESDRLLPSIAAFRDRAESLLALLTGGA